MPPRLAALLFAASTILTASATAQSAPELVAQGNTAYDARDVPAALKDYEAALALDPKNYQALWRAARANVDLGEYDPNHDHRTALYKTAEQHARLAVQVDSTAPDGHFALALALGRTALSLGTRDRIKYAKAIRNEALTCLQLAPTHAGCLHIMGVWNAEVMRLNGFSRMIAKHFLGGQVFDQASWSEAQRYLVAAVTNDPRRIIHRLDLARVYVDRGMTTQARTQFQAVIDGPLIDYNDPRYKAEATKELREL